jgi:GTP-binding protein
MQHMETTDAGVKINFLVPTRGLMGYRNEFTIDTKGEGILTSVFHSFQPHAGSIERSSFGSMVSMATGKALGFSLANLGQRGVLYIEPNTEVYEGQVIGYTSRGDELQVNPTKGKQLTNMRASGSDEQVKITPPYLLDLERGLGIMDADEYLEITPDAIRLRKAILREADRKRQQRQSKG